jgi:hypothetical protein
MDHETALVNAFVLPERRARLLELLQNRKRRWKALNSLYHFRALDTRFIVPIPSASRHPAAIEALLADRGAPAECHVISTNGELDGRDLPLHAVITQIVGRFILARGPS